MTDFYDELAPYYHLLFDDWDAGIERQGRLLASVIRDRWPGTSTVLDVSCGIGTQAIALAQNGFRVTASDLSAGAIDRAKLETQERGLDISFSVCDMLSAHSHHGGGFDVVISCDNALPHLLTDDGILAALKQLHACARPGGGCLVTIRDYEQEKRGKNILKPYGTRVVGANRYVLFQVWDFEGDIYDLTLYIVQEDLYSKQVKTESLHSRYYAISTTRMMQLMEEAGFGQVKRVDTPFLPFLLGTVPA
jgi:2-polyprenyl-3-methyl-5-hydroxy-6-metoxy-1,4-benzoquinol methylase